MTLPTGGKANRVFRVWTLRNVADVGSDSPYWQARAVDPTGAVNVYAGEYQQAAMAKLRQLEAPAYVAVTGKPRVYEPEDGDGAYVSLRPESVQVDDEASDDYHLGDHNVKNWAVQIQASLSAWTTLYNALDELDDAVDDTTISRLDPLETVQEHGVPGPTFDVVCAVAATHCGNDFKQTDHLIAYTDETNGSERL